jgi:hypothetical protein
MASSRQTSSFHFSQKTISALRSSSMPLHGMLAGLVFSFLCRYACKKSQQYNIHYSMHFDTDQVLIFLALCDDRRDAAGSIVGVIGVGQVPQPSWPPPSYPECLLRKTVV